MSYGKKQTELPKLTTDKQGKLQGGFVMRTAKCIGVRSTNTNCDNTPGSNDTNSNCKCTNCGLIVLNCSGQLQTCTVNLNCSC